MKVRKDGDAEFADDNAIKLVSSFFFALFFQDVSRTIEGSHTELYKNVERVSFYMGLLSVQDTVDFLPS